MALRAERVINLLRQCRGGSDYDTRFGHRMRGTGPFAALLQRRFEVCCRRLSLRVGEAWQGRTDLFLPPADRDGRQCLQYTTV